MRGWVKVVSYSRPVENILTYRRWWLTHSGGYEATVVQAEVHSNGVVAQISGADGQPITDRDIAATLVGAEIQVYRADMPVPEAGEHYWVDLIGLEVRNLEGVKLGKVTDMTSNGAQDVMVLHDGEQERMIPFVSGPIVKNVDVAAGVVVCDWQPEY